MLVDIFCRDESRQSRMGFSAKFHFNQCFSDLTVTSHFYNFYNFQIKMNVKKKFRSKLRIFESFNGKTAWYQDDSCKDDSVPVLLAVKQGLEEQEVEKETHKLVVGQEEPVKLEKSKDKSLRRQRYETVFLNG